MIVRPGNVAVILGVAYSVGSVRVGVSEGSGTLELRPLRPIRSRGAGHEVDDDVMEDCDMSSPYLRLSTAVFDHLCSTAAVVVFDKAQSYRDYADAPAKSDPRNDKSTGWDPDIIVTIESSAGCYSDSFAGCYSDSFAGAMAMLRDGLSVTRDDWGDAYIYLADNNTIMFWGDSLAVLNNGLPLPYVAASCDLLSTGGWKRRKATDSDSAQWAPAPGTSINHSFEEALALAKKGACIARAGWNGKGMMVTVFTPKSSAQRPYLMMRTADNQLVPWVASQSDLLAYDWAVTPVGRVKSTTCGEWPS